MAEKKLTVKEKIESLIKDEEFHIIGSKTVVCCLILKNGVEIIEEYSFNNPKSFDFDKGSKYAREKAIRKISSELESYRLQCEYSGYYCRKYNVFENEERRIGNKKKFVTSFLVIPTSGNNVNIVVEFSNGAKESYKGKTAVFEKEEKKDSSNKENDN